jgi:hypothetical protein
MHMQTPVLAPVSIVWADVGLDAATTAIEQPPPQPYPPQDTEE